MPIGGAREGSTNPLVRTALALSLALGSAVACSAMDSTQFLRTMAGKWVGDGMTLVIDADTLQANTDPEKPFEWRSLRILNVTGNVAVFEIGPDRFLGLIDPVDTMTVTRVGLLGQYKLHSAKTPP